MSATRFFMVLCICALSGLVTLTGCPDETTTGNNNQACVTAGDCPSGVCEGEACVTVRAANCHDVSPANASPELTSHTISWVDGQWEALPDCAWSCDIDYSEEDGACIDTRAVECTDNPPANATSTVEAVQVAYTDADGWADPADCAWTCNTDWTEDAGACINSRTETCTDNAPDNATSTAADVTTTYTTADGWSAPADCAWACDADYDENNGVCINTQIVPCTDNTPANATGTVIDVAISYTDADGWATPIDCEWTCDADYGQVGDECLNSQTVTCDGTGIPDNATASATEVTITYTDADGWSTNACPWACDADYDDLSGACLNTQMVACVENTPANATTVTSDVEITYTDAGGWTTVADCGWTCDTGYAEYQGGCVTGIQVQCNDNPPANATSVIADVTVAPLPGGGFQDPADCAWSCSADYAEDNGACINSKDVACVDAGAPANATVDQADVTITYTDAGGWTTAADCGWTCDDGYAELDGACVNGIQVACNDNPPANATSILANVWVALLSDGTYADPADCEWDCDTNYGEVDSACIDTQTASCTDNAPANGTSTIADVTITFTTAGGWETPADCAWSCDTDFAESSGSCINTDTAQCMDTAPANATATFADVTITYTTAGGWTTPADCAWTCNADWAEDSGACVNTDTVACSDNPPANATSTFADVTITYTTDGGWTTPADCAWTCDTDYAEDGGACINSRDVQCNDTAPPNSTPDFQNVTIAYTTAGGWTTPADCAWSCNTDYAESTGSCINTDTAQCTDNAPANATSTAADVTITYTTAGGWTTPADCAWSCNTDYAESSGSCIDSDTVSCTDNAPANATATVDDVTITFTTTGGWTTPADCAWSCDTDYFQDTGACINSRQEPCVDNPPADATSTNADVTVTYTTAGGWTTPADCAWTCDTGFGELAGACVSGQQVQCHDNPPANATSIIADVWVAPLPGGGWTDPADCDYTCDTDYWDDGSACVNSQQVDCNDNSPANASPVITQVTITYTTAGGWTTPADCAAYTCDTDYFDAGSTCIDTQQVQCTDNAPANATPTLVNVTINYTTAGGWETPADCAWSCDTDYFEDSGACINTRQVQCVDNTPPNSTTVIANVTITYTTAGGWSTPADCAYNCNADYFDTGSACINQQTVQCADNSPANSTATIADVTINYTTAGGWETPADCAWSCNTDYFDAGTSCIDSQQVQCTDAAPPNATSTVADVTITYTTAGGWTTPADCAWSCNTDWFEESGACINQRTVQCADNPPANGTSVIADVTITYTTAGGWETPADCAYSCNTDFWDDGNACINQQQVNCDDVAPNNATSTIVQVTINYTTAGGWETPADCAWSCDADYADVGGSCINSQSVPCTDNPPANGTSVIANVIINYTDAGGWETPADCGYTCNTDYWDDGSACINSQDVQCTDNAPANATSTLANVTITYTTAGGWTTPADCAWTCNTGYVLQSGVCVATGPVCGDGTISVSPPEVCDDGNDCAKDGCSADTGGTCQLETTFVMNTMSIDGNAGFDVDNADTDDNPYTGTDNSIGDAGGLVASTARGELNDALADAFADGSLILTTVLTDLDSLTSDDELSVVVQPGLDPDCPNNPTYDGGNPPPWLASPPADIYSDSDVWDVTQCIPPTEIDDTDDPVNGLYNTYPSGAWNYSNRGSERDYPGMPALHGHADTLDISLGAFGAVTITNAYLEAQLTNDGTDATGLLDGKLGGVWSIPDLLAVDTSSLFGTNCPTMLHVLRAFFGQPDIDLDGGGTDDINGGPQGCGFLEFACLNCAYVIAECENDGDTGQTTSGSNCVNDASMGDGYSVGINFTAIPVNIISQESGTTYCP